MAKPARIDSPPLRDRTALVQIALPPAGHIFSETYLDECSETLELLVERGARIIITAHPVFGGGDSVSFAPYAEALTKRLKTTVPFFAADEIKKAGSALAQSRVVLLDNLLHIQGESGAAKTHVKALAELADVYVNEAFATSHESYSTQVHLPELKKGATFAGMRHSQQIDTLTDLMAGRPSPVFFIMGGQDVPGSIQVLRKNLAAIKGYMVGGILANTVLKGNALAMGASVLDAGRISEAFQIVERGRLQECIVELPGDHVIADRISKKAKVKSCGREVPEGWMSVDVGSKTLSIYEKLLKKAGAIYWHGPLGASDVEDFAAGSLRLLKSLSKYDGTLLLSGEDTCRLAHQAGISPAFLFPDSQAIQRTLAGQDLPGRRALG